MAGRSLFVQGKGLLSFDNLRGNVLENTKSQPNRFALSRRGNYSGKSVPAGSKHAPPVVCFVKRKRLGVPTSHGNCITIFPATKKLGKSPQAKVTTCGQGKGLPSSHH